MHGPVQKPTHLGLLIADHKCAGCGNKWISSHACLTNSRFGIVGSSRLAPGEERLPFAGFRKWGETVYHPGCFRCVPLQLGIGWEKPELIPPPREASKPQTAKPQAIDDGKKSILDI